MSTTTSELSRATRGTKRACQSCAVRFYDLARDPIVCPSCGAVYDAAAQPVVEVVARTAPFSGKTGWRSKSPKQPEPAPMESDPEVASTDGAIAEDAAEGTTPDTAEDEVILEVEAEDGDVSDLVVHEDDDQKDR
jgi:uncharacterized protein (TIGR02300 family)